MDEHLQRQIDDLEKSIQPPQTVHDLTPPERTLLRAIGDCGSRMFMTDKELLETLSRVLFFYVKLVAKDAGLAK